MSKEFLTGVYKPVVKKLLFCSLHWYKNLIEHGMGGGSNMKNNLCRIAVPQADTIRSIGRDNFITDSLKILKQHQSRLTYRQYKTLRGQIISGDIQGAKRGLHKIINS